MNFHPLGTGAMSSDETAKIEPTLIAKDGLAASEKPTAIDAKPKAEAKADALLIKTPALEIVTAAAKDEALKLEPKVEAKTEPKTEAKIEPKIAAKTAPTIEAPKSEPPGLP